MRERQAIESKLRRLAGMSPEKLAQMHAAAGSQMWWARCWNCRKQTQFRRDTLDHATCEHCGVSLARRG